MKDVIISISGKVLSRVINGKNEPFIWNKKQQIIQESTAEKFSQINV